MSDDGRKYLRDVLDELDRFFEDLEKDIHDSLKEGFSSSKGFFKRPFVAGVQMRIGPEGKPSIQFFGDSKEAEGFRTPIHEQVLDEAKGSLRLVVELPGVEKADVQLSAQEERVVIEAARGARKYKSEIALKASVDPDSGKAEFKNGVLEILFSSKDKANKGYKRVNVV